ncbi:PQQ-binding-like beta-propeller repeat protein [Streptomyces prunicolor]|uniref:outer membrane protein assembly factor BamB family protein n=1 Tax=Streptomyces prunicolor TaxID=67348 RepID=UPI00371CCBCE
MYEDKAPESAWKHSWWRRSAHRLWRTTRETGDQGEEPLGLWLTDDTVVIARFDRVQAYRVTTGAPQWTWRPPGRQVVVLMSADTEDGVGVVLHYDDGQRDVKHVGLTSLAVATGEVVRHREQDADLLGQLRSEVAIGGGLIATAREFWTERPVVCALDVGTGKVRWKHELTDPRVEGATVLSARPFVASLKMRGARDRPRLFVLGDDGTKGVGLALPDGYTRFGSRVAMVGDVLAVQLEPAEEAERDKGVRLGAYSVSSGRFLWKWYDKGGYWVTPLAHRGWLLVVHRSGGRLSVLDPATGRLVARRTLRGGAYDPFLGASGDLIAVGCRPTELNRRLRVFRWR